MFRIIAVVPLNYHSLISHNFFGRPPTCPRSSIEIVPVRFCVTLPYTHSHPESRYYYYYYYFVILILLLFNPLTDETRSTGSDVRLTSGPSVFSRSGLVTELIGARQYQVFRYSPISAFRSP